MDRYAIFVDAGYFFAAGAQAAFGDHTPRKQVTLKSSTAMLVALCAKASAIADNLPLLRTYWYDAMPGPRLTLEQSELAMLTGVKLRLGALNSAGEQKGVDSLIVTDIIDLARNRAIANAVVVTGDEDLRIAVHVAQSFGVRVHILAAGDPAKNVSPSLQMEADSVDTLDGDWFSNHLKLIPTVRKASASATPVVPVSHIPTTDKTTTEEIDTAVAPVIKEILENIASEQLAQLIQHFSTQKIVPPEYDRCLVAKTSANLGRRLSGDEMRHLRGLFVRAVKARTATTDLSIPPTIPV
ncbi:MAG: NYN domain-containing protein [Ferrovum myxofaciens]|uniref:NYN domain-containing protein n=1 Tax=Ferrovum myxofaciens TaxID=416213 RepID=UPI0023578DA1|nr:NYN domain-containing protein [Ferrovum myxofaciens]QKE40874.1 MAG: NYN domain-containing protein [Ferrovum myxofaciens]